MDLESRLANAAAVVAKNGITKSRAKYAELYREALRTSDMPASGKVKSGKARMEKLTPEQRKELARQGAVERWRRARERQLAASSEGKPGGNASVNEETGEVLSSIPNDLPVAKWPGELELGIACYVLTDGKRIISRTGATNFLTQSKGGGNLESYTKSYCFAVVESVAVVSFDRMKDRCVWEESFVPYRRDITVDAPHEP